MPFANLYKSYIEAEVSVGKTAIKPRNVYIVESYVYADGKQKSFSGNNTAYVFVIGISPEKIISCIKLSEIKPDKFFKWLQPLFNPGITNEAWEKSKTLDEVLKKSGKDGSGLFAQFVKTSPIYNLNPTPYRTYSLQGIKQASEVKFKKDFLKSIHPVLRLKTEKPKPTTPEPVETPTPTEAKTKV